MRMSLFVAAAPLLLFAPNNPTSVLPEDEPHALGQDDPSPVGLWVVSEAQWREVDERARRSGYSTLPPGPFYFDGKTVTMYLFTLHKWQRHTRDGYYRVSTKWDGSDLYWLTSSETWAKQATFRNGRFEFKWGEATFGSVRLESTREDDEDWLLEVVWRYERVPLSQVSEGLRPLIQKREENDWGRPGDHE
jgi:hypothetical protein